MHHWCTKQIVFLYIYYINISTVVVIISMSRITVVLRVVFTATATPGKHQGHRAHRERPGHVRNGGDPLRAAGALCRSQLRHLGLTQRSALLLPAVRSSSNSY